METYIQLIKNLQDLNQEIKQKLLSMPLYTEQEMKRLEVWLELTEKQVKNLETVFSPTSLHLKTLREEFEMLREKDI